MWLVSFVAVPQLHITYELRMRFAADRSWDCLVYVEGHLKSSFSGEPVTTANELFDRIFAAIGAAGHAIATGD